MSADIAVVHSRVRAEEKALFEALERRNLPYVGVDARRLYGFADAAPVRWRVGLNRELSLSRAVHAARTLEAQGLHMVNSASATEVCGDKWRTTLALVRAGVPTPRSALALTPEAALRVLDELDYPAVFKPLTGSWGRRVSRINDREAAVAVLEHIEALPSPTDHLVYVQELIRTPGRDIRVVVVDGTPLGAVHRTAREWRTNVARGAEVRPCPLTDELARLATTAAVAVGADLAGVDLVEAEDGRLLVLEVNAGVEFAGFQRALGGAVDVADRIVDVLERRAAS
ncbi:RimK family alpha-L-glutamate ligase [Streptomyces sp. NPDC093591]|uniref:RimK family alpha-L-glutamate ligase n=1 Tax=Streptomyces sp. NPDC093591 TaxID=3366044 RepID=UPI00380E15D5